MKETVVLLPTYNERENISILVREITACEKEIRIVVIDDNSPDGTGSLVRELMKEFPNLSLFSRPQKQGLGEAYKAGIKHVLSNPDIEKIITMDADGSHSPEYISALLSRDADLVIGSRYVTGGDIQNWELWRYVLSFGGNLYARVLTWLPLKDLTSGFMCVRADMLRRVDFSKIHASGYAFQIEIKFHIFYVLHGRALEIPIIFKSRRGGESKMSNHIIREGLKTPLRLFLYRTGALYNRLFT